MIFQISVCVYILLRGSVQYFVRCSWPIHLSVVDLSIYIVYAHWTVWKKLLELVYCSARMFHGHRLAALRDLHPDMRLSLSLSFLFYSHIVHRYLDWLVCWSCCCCLVLYERFSTRSTHQLSLTYQRQCPAANNQTYVLACMITIMPDKEMNKWP